MFVHQGQTWRVPVSNLFVLFFLGGHFCQLPCWDDASRRSAGVCRSSTVAGCCLSSLCVLYSHFQSQSSRCITPLYHPTVWLKPHNHLLILHCRYRSRGCIWGLIWMGGRGWASRKPTRAAFDSNKVRRINRLWSETCKEKQELSTGAGGFSVDTRECAWAPAASRPHVKKKEKKSLNTVLLTHQENLNQLENRSNSPQKSDENFTLSSRVRTTLTQSSLSAENNLT